MASYMICYDLYQDGQQYEKIEKEIQKLGECVKVLRTTWVLNSESSLYFVKAMLETVTDNNDKIIIVSLDNKAACLRLDYSIEKWLREHHFELE